MKNKGEGCPTDCLLGLPAPRVIKPRTQFNVDVFVGGITIRIQNCIKA
ncbi:MAG: hypothetical protein ACI9SK_002740, partial [Zhongshania sp.]